MNLKHGIKRLMTFLRPNPLVRLKLCGVPLCVYKGTIRPKIDQDDSWWFHLSKHHEILYDIGCNVGYTALLALIQNPTKKMLLVDPNSDALKVAASNLILNGLGGQVYYYNALVSNTVDNRVKFYTIGTGAAGSIYETHAKSAFSSNSFRMVNSVTLDYLYSFYKLKPDLVKIDVEGAETSVMEGAKAMASETQCSFFVEMHKLDHLSMEHSAQFMLNWCMEMDYRAWYLKTGEELKHSETIKHRGKCHLLLLPRSKDYPFYLNGIKPNTPLPKSL